MSEKTNAEACALINRLWHSWPEDAEQPVANALAAAEERGRRSGVEELADLLLACEEALIWCSAADAFRPDGIAALGWQRVVLPVLERVRIARKSLAPRDSGPARYCNEPHPSQALKCGRFVQHDGPHTAFVPGYDSEQRAAVHWEARK